MLRAFYFGVWTQEVAAFRCTTRLWCWRVFSALAFPTPHPPTRPFHPSELLAASSALVRSAWAEVHLAELGFSVHSAQSRQG